MHLILKVLNLKIFYDKVLFLLLIFGSGATYYAFERFSMSTIYEIFGSSLIIYLTFKYSTSKEEKLKNFYLFLVPVSQFLMLTNRWNNFHYFLIPFIFQIINKRDIKYIFKNVYFFFGNTLGVILFLGHTKLIYGIYTLSQSSIYPPLTESLIGSRLQKFLNFSNLFDNFIFATKYLFITCFSFEFGIFYFSSIIFASTYFLIIYIIKKRYKLFFILIITYVIPFLPILIFENHGTSYGFRYLFSLIPINLYLYFKDFQNHKFLHSYLVLFSFFGVIAQLFFETSEYSSLSEFTIVNSFNSNSAYSNPDMLTGIFKSIFFQSSYLKIIFTSFLGIFILKFLNLFVNIFQLVNDLYYVDDKLNEHLTNVISFSWLYMFLILAIVFISLKSLHLKPK